MFNCTALYGWHCFSCDLKPCGPWSDSILYVVWKLVLSLRTGCVHSCVFSLCRLLIVVRGRDELFSYLCHLIRRYIPSTSGFLASYSLFSSHFLFQWAFSETWHTHEWQLECEHENSLRYHTRGYWRLVLLRLSHERELCLCGQNCSLQTKPHIYTHDMSLVSKVHSLQPITESTPSHFLC